MHDISPLVLAAGFGNRLRPLTDVLPKPAVPLLGEPLAGYSLARLFRAGCPRAVLNAHHLADRLLLEIQAWVSRALPAMDLRFSVERPEILGTGGALVAARELLGEGTLAVVNGDILCDFDLPALVAAHRASGAAATLLLVDHPDVERFGAVRTDQAGRVVDLAGKAKRRADAVGGAGGAAKSAGVFAGVHLVEPEVFDALPAAGPSCIVRQGYAPMMAAGRDVRGVFHPGRWNDLGTPERYLETHGQLLDDGYPGPAATRLLWGDDAPRVAGLCSGIDAAGEPWGDADTVQIDTTARLVGPLALGPGVHIGSDAVVGPRAVVGAGARIGAGARVVDSVVWPGAAIAAGAELQAAVAFRSGGRDRVLRTR